MMAHSERDDVVLAQERSIAQQSAIVLQTPAQRYFIGWALDWMENIRPENLAVRVKTDVHSPSFLRVNGPISNLPEFYKAFAVKPGDKMYRSPEARVEIW